MNDVLVYLQKNKDIPIYIHVVNNKLKIRSTNSEDNNERSFNLSLVTKKSFFRKTAKEIYYINKIKNLKVFLDNSELLDDNSVIKIDTKIKIDNISFSLETIMDAELKTHPLIEVQNLTVALKNKVILSDINFSIKRGEFLAIMGPSGCGKSTLIKELAGENHKVKGEIRLNNQSISNSFHSDLKANIGYVEQFDERNLYQDLTVSQMLAFTSKIRRVSCRADRIVLVIEKLLLSKLKFRIINSLSGGQTKRVAIANELLDLPDILLLDEPTSPLDPESIESFLEFMKNYAHDYNKAVVMVTHKPTDLEYVDKVLFLSTGGYQIYFGVQNDFKENILKKRFQGKVLELYKKYSLNEAKAQYANEAKNNKILKFETQRASLATNNKTHSFLHQWYYLVQRYFSIKFPHAKLEGDATDVRGIKSLRSNIGQAVGIGLLFWSLPFFNLTALFLISLSTIWLGVNNSSKEIVQEINIYKRERGYNLRIHAYLFSKIFILSILALVQISVILFMVWLRYHNQKVYLLNSLSIGCFLFFLSVSSTIFGLFLSTLDEKVEKVLIYVPLVLMTQIVFSGLVSKPDRVIKENISYFMLGRWGLEAISRIQDANAPRKRIKVSYKTINAKNDSISKDTTLLVPKSIIIDRPLSAKPTDTLRSDTVGALSSLGSYDNRLKRDNYQSWTIFDSLFGNYVVVAFLGLLSYLLCFALLLNKDHIQYSSVLNKRNVFSFFLLLFICIEMFFVASPAFKNLVRPKFDSTQLDKIKRQQQKLKDFIDNREWYKNNRRK